MRIRPARHVLACVLAVVTLTTAACVGPVLVDEHYRGKAISALDASRSTVAAVALLAEQLEHDRVPGAMTAVIVRQKEEEAAWHRAAFATRQPPPGGDDLRREVEPLLDAAVTMLEDLRIVAFRGDLERVVAARASLEDLVSRLEDKVEELRRRTGPL